MISVPKFIAFAAMLSCLPLMAHAADSRYLNVTVQPKTPDDKPADTQKEAEPPKPAAGDKPADKPADAPATPKAATADPLGNWGLGVAIAHEWYDHHTIKKASITGPDKKVIIDDEYDSGPAFWAVGTWTPIWRNYFTRSTWVPGLWMGVGLTGEQKVLDSFGGGFQITLFEMVSKYDKTNDKVVSVRTPAWSVGVGRVNHTFKRFAHGIVENEPLPADYAEPKLVDRRGDDWVLMVTKLFASGAGQ